MTAMANGVKYLIMTIVFLGIIKLLQMTSFDGEKYDAMEKKRVEKYVKKAPEKFNTSKKKVPKKSKSNKDVPPGKSVKSTSKEESALSDLKVRYLDPILENLPPDGLRKDIFVRYYRHNKDGIGVYKLEEMGYYMHQKPATETAGLGSNIIYYGDDVPLDRTADLLCEIRLSHPRREDFGALAGLWAADCGFADDFCRRLCLL